jgi:hypothetical protein
MKIVALGLVLACTVCSPVLAQSNKDSYQSGTIVSVDNVPVHTSDGGADAPLKSNVADHDVSIQVGHTVYVCRYHTVSDFDLSWLRNKNVQVKIKGKVMYVKRATGEDAKAQIVSTTKATSG